jgi:hypothetical protein
VRAHPAFDHQHARADRLVHREEAVERPRDDEQRGGDERGEREPAPQGGDPDLGAADERKALQSARILLRAELFPVKRDGPYG